MLTASVVFKTMKRFTIQISADQLTELADERMKLSIFEKKSWLRTGISWLRDDMNRNIELP